MDFAREGISPPLTVLAENGADALLQSGIVAMAQFGSWPLSNFKANEFFRQNCDVVILPKSVSGKRATIYNGLG